MEKKVVDSLDGVLFRLYPSEVDNPSLAYPICKLGANLIGKLLECVGDCVEEVYLEGRSLSRLSNSLDLILIPKIEEDSIVRRLRNHNWFYEDQVCFNISRNGLGMIFGDYLTNPCNLHD